MEILIQTFLKCKIDDRREIMQHFFLDYLVLIKTKLKDGFPIAQFNISDYEPRARCDKNQLWGSLIQNVRKEISLQQFQTK